MILLSVLTSISEGIEYLGDNLDWGMIALYLFLALGVSFLCSLLEAIILFFMGSGTIKGFSLTLGVGIFTTLFSVYFIARLLTVLYISKNKEKQGLI